MRCDIEHRCTGDDWKGILNDPNMNGSFKINEGLQLTRRLFVDITTMGLPLTTELLGALSSLYLADLVSGGVIGARMAESLQRELASGAEVPMGLTNNSNKNLKIIINTIKTTSTNQHYISSTPEGRTEIA
jgi:3-deoxy-7-phosphoheptulonate synthase